MSATGNDQTHSQAEETTNNDQKIKRKRKYTLLEHFPEENFSEFYKHT